MLLLTLFDAHGQSARKAIVNDSIEFNGSWMHQGQNYPFFLERAPVGWQCFLAGLGNNSYFGMNWSPWSGGDMIREAADNGFDIVMHYGEGYIPDPDGTSDPASADYAAQNGCAVFTYLSGDNSPRNGPHDYRGPGSPILGIGPTPAMTVSGGYSTSSGAETSYGLQSEFIDAIVDPGHCEQSYAHSATAARYAKLKDWHPTWNVFDLRQVLRQTCTFYAEGWREDGGYGFPKVLNRTGNSFQEATINNKNLAEIDFADLDVGPPIQPSAQISPDGTQVTFRWYNFRQTSFASTVIKVNGTTVFDGDATSFIWTSTVSSVATAEFFTKLNDGRISRSTTLDSYARILLPFNLPNSFSVIRDTAPNLNVFGNDNNPALSLASISGLSNPNAGTITINSDNRTVDFTPAHGWFGTTTFTYNITDGVGLAQVTATLNVIPTPGNVPPTISSIADQQMAQNATIAVPFTVGDDFSSPDNLTYVVTCSNPTLISLNLTRIGANCVLHISSIAEPGSGTITLTVKDEDLGVTTKSFQIKVLENVPTLASGNFSGNAFSFNISGLAGCYWGVYSSGDLVNWGLAGGVTLDSYGTGSFTDNNVTGMAHRFYKLSNGDCCSQAIGFERLTMQPGYNFVANQLDAPTNTLDGLFTPTMPDGNSLPDGTEIWKFDFQQPSQFDVYTFSSGSWSPNGNATLAPGEAAFVKNNSDTNFTVTFVGLVREGQLTVPLASGSNNAVSSMVPQAGGIQSVLGYNPSDGAEVSLWRDNTWVFYYYDVIWDANGNQTGSGWYESDYSTLTTEPVVNVGEAVLIVPSSANETWTRNFSACGANSCNAPSLGQEQISGSTFSFNINSGPPNSYWGVYSSGDLVNWGLAGGVTLDSYGTGSFTDNNVTGMAHRFYKLSNGDCCSQAIGFERVTAVPSYTAIANQLDAPVNTLANVFTHISQPDGTPISLPDGTVVQLWNQSQQQWTNYTWNGGQWLSDGNATLSPGAGALIQNNSGSPFTVTFVGLVREGQLTIPLGNGYNYFVSSMVPQAGGIQSVLGYNPSDGAEVSLWRDNTWVFYYYDVIWDANGNQTGSGWYESDYSTLTTEPVVNVGEAVLIVPSSANETWTRNFSACH